MSTYCIIGTGFIASAFRKRLPDATWYPTEDTKYLLYLSGPNHMDFEKSPQYHSENEITNFEFLLKYCRKNKIKLIFMSSALVYEKNIAFTRCKKLMEDLAYKENALALRCFPIYGKGSYTVISKWIDQIKNDERPEIWGDGTQYRDFIHIDDVIDLTLTHQDDKGIIDVAGGKPITFNEVVATINKVLGKNIEPIYEPIPNYIDYDPRGIYSKNPLPTKISLEEGIKTLCEV